MKNTMKYVSLGLIFTAATVQAGKKNKGPKVKPSQLEQAAPAGASTSTAVQTETADIEKAHLVNLLDESILAEQQVTAPAAAEPVKTAQEEDFVEVLKRTSDAASITTPAAPATTYGSWYNPLNIAIALGVVSGYPVETPSAPTELQEIPTSRSAAGTDATQTDKEMVDAFAAARIEELQAEKDALKAKE